ncbi:MAG TPA: hypothetical protein VHG08_04420 [Longimicrobium sp.]|nr:hypothetical protein [Longimicrobium sp.]
MIVRGVPDVSASTQPFGDCVAQAAAWCGPRADLADPRSCLRTPSLAPRILSPDYFSAVDSVLVNRREVLGQPFGWPRSGEGRLMVYFPDADLCDGAAELETGGWFDVYNTPPWDTWAGFFQDDRPGSDAYARYLVAWVPPAFVEIVGRGIYVNPEQCIAWLDDTDCEIRQPLARSPGILARLFRRG